MIGPVRRATVSVRVRKVTVARWLAKATVARVRVPTATGRVLRVIVARWLVRVIVGLDLKANVRVDLKAIGVKWLAKATGRKVGGSVEDSVDLHSEPGQEAL